MDCGNLVNITIPGNVKVIGWNAIRECDRLESVTIEDGVEEISAYAFFLDYSLESIKIPKSVKKIGDYAFADCNNLKVAYLPDFYKDNFDTYVGDNAFISKTEIKYYQTDGSTVVEPAKPVVTAEPTYGGAEVTWKPVDGAINYRVFTCVPGQKIRQFGSDTKGTSMTVKGLNGGQKTGIIVLAQFANKKWSTYTEDDIVYVTPLDAVKPYLCVNPKADGKVYLIWSSVPTSVRYKVMAREVGTKDWELIGATRQRCRITVDGFDPNKQYEFLVRGLNAKGKYTPMAADDIVVGTSLS